jgi:hypothetical protein
MIEMAAKLETALKNQQDHMSDDLTLSQQRAAKRSQRSLSSNSTSSHSKMSQDSSQDSSIYKSPEKKKPRPRDGPPTAPTITTYTTTSAISHNASNQRQIKDHPDDPFNQAVTESDAVFIDQDHLSEASDVCLNLDDIFNQTNQSGLQSSLSKASHPLTETTSLSATAGGNPLDFETVRSPSEAQADPLTIHDSHLRSLKYAAALGTTRNTAPLNHQYTNPNDSAGATPT